MPIGDGAGTITRGQRTTAAVTAARIKLDVDPKLFNVSADLAPMYAFFKKLKKVHKTKNPLNYWYNTDELYKYVTTNGTTTAAGTTLTVATPGGDRVNPGTLLKVQRTGEVMRVSAVGSATSLTVVRGVGGTSGAATVTGEDILILGSAHLEGTTSGSGISSEPGTAIYNVCQTFRQPVDLSARDLVIDVYGGDEKTRLIRDAKMKMMGDIETSLLTSNARSTSDPTIMGGLEYFATDNAVNVGGALTEQVLIDSFIIPFFRVNASKKNLMVFAGEKFCRALNLFGLDNIRYAPSDTGIGINVLKYKSSFGEFEVFQHGGLTPEGYTDVTAANLGLQGYFYGANLDLIELVEMEGRGMKLRLGNPETGINAPDVDGWKSEWLADISLKVKGNRNHIVGKGITG